jgi:hypothetical protein
VPTGDEKTCPARYEGIDAGQNVHQIAKLLFDGLTDLADARPLLLGHGQRLLPGFLAVRTRLEDKGFSDLRVYLVNQLVGHFSCLTENA